MPPLTSAGDDLDFGSVASRDYYMLQIEALASGNIVPRIQFNNDTANNYADRQNENGDPTDDTNTSVASIRFDPNVRTTPMYITMFIDNVAIADKLLVGHSVHQGVAGSGSGDNPNRSIFVGKWSNLTDQIDDIRIFNSDTGDFAIGSTARLYGSPT